MKLRIVALGHKMPGWVASGFDEYARRLPRDFELELVELKPEPRARAGNLPRMLAAEAARIAHACKGYRSVALDERGAAWSTRELAAHLRTWQEAGYDVAFVIGSADGLHP